jgi:hypothetical protein
MPSLPGIPASMQQRLELPSVSLAQSLSLSRQQEHLMALANSSAASVAASAAGGLGGPPPGPNPEKLGMTNGAPGGSLKMGNIAETCERIKEEFNFIQNQYHSLKLECEKLAQEKTEMQRHYVMYYEMSYGLNVEMHKQTEICKRLDAIIRQVLPFLNGEHQQQVAVAVERAKQITMTELTALMQAAGGPGGLPGAPPRNARSSCRTPPGSARCARHARISTLLCCGAAESGWTPGDTWAASHQSRPTHGPQGDEGGEATLRYGRETETQQLCLSC